MQGRGWEARRFRKGSFAALGAVLVAASMYFTAPPSSAAGIADVGVAVTRPARVVPGASYTNTVTLSNKGKFPHDMLFDGKGVHDVGIHNAHAVAPGKSAKFTVTFPKAGTFEFYCAIKGHRAKGMEGKVKVT